MGAIGGVLFFLGICGFWVSAFAVIKPLKTLKLGTRKRALIGVGCAFLLMGAGTIVGGPAERGPSPAPLPTKTTQSEDVNPADPAAERASVLAAVSRYFATYQTTSDHCNVAFQAVSAEASGRAPSIQNMYALATDARDRCRETSMAFDGMRPPEGVTRDQRRSFDQAARTCALAYAGQQRAAEALMAAIDDNLKPSRVARFQQLGQEAMAGKLACGAQVSQAAQDTGLEIPTTGPSD